MVSTKYRKLLTEYLKRFTYKSNFRFEIQDAPYTAPHDTLVLTCFMEVPHRDTGDRIEIRSSTLLDARNSYMDEKEFLIRIKNVIIQMEIHEVDEWIKWDGVRVNDPHKE